MDQELTPEEPRMTKNQGLSILPEATPMLLLFLLLLLLSFLLLLRYLGLCREASDRVHLRTYESKVNDKIVAQSAVL